MIITPHQFGLLVQSLHRLSELSLVAIEVSEESRTQIWLHSKGRNRILYLFVNHQLLVDWAPYVDSIKECVQVKDHLRISFVN